MCPAPAPCGSAWTMPLDLSFKDVAVVQTVGRASTSELTTAAGSPSAFSVLQVHHESTADVPGRVP